MIRPLTALELGQAVDWAAAEGWNPGLDDAAAFGTADAEGFLGHFEGESLAATISAVRYDSRFGFLGFYICRPDLRGRGLGLRLWRAAMAQFGDRVVGLDGVVAQQENYRASGFEFAHRTIRYGGLLSGSAGGSPIDADRVLAYDRPFFPAPRGAFLRRWLAPAGGAALMAVEDGACRGYGVRRPCRSGHKIGPLFADTPGIAEQLLAALAPDGEEVFLDVPEPNREGVSLAERLGLAPVFEVARMYRGPTPDLPLRRIYGVTSFELG